MGWNPNSSVACGGGGRCSTFLPQQEGVEGHVVDAEVEEALPGHPALPAAARVVSHQLLRRRQAEVQLELLQRLPELPGVVLLGRLPALDLLGDEALQTRRGSWGSAVEKNKTKNQPHPWAPSDASHLDFSFDEAGHILLVLEDGQRLQQVVEQPIPVLVHLLRSGA